MIVGLGLDICELDRVQRAWDRFGERFARRILTPDEFAALPEGNPVPFLAARFAAKEAASKALGTGIRDGVGFQTLEVRNDASGKPELLLHGGAAERLHALGATTSAHLSITHGRDTAAAVVILER